MNNENMMNLFNGTSNIENSFDFSGNWNDSDICTTVYVVQRGDTLSEIAYRNEWISKDDVLKEAKKYAKTEYGKYLRRIAAQDFEQYKAIYESELFNSSF